MLSFFNNQRKMVRKGTKKFYSDIFNDESQANRNAFSDRTEQIFRIGCYISVIIMSWAVTTAIWLDFMR